MNFVLPPEIRVTPHQVALEDLQDPSNNISQYTAMFRDDTGIDETFSMATESAAPSEPLQVVSAGCSFGAEVDTVLALAHKHTPEAYISIVGVDANTAALQTAGQARYRLGEDFASVAGRYAGQGYDFMKTMDEHGIGAVPYDIDTKSPVLRTAALRAEHDVTWRQGDLGRDALTTCAANLILCNNVIYYFRRQPEIADAIALNLAAHLAVGGIVSFGANLQYVSMEGWARDVVPKLAAQGVEPLATSNPAQVAFRRIA